MNLFIFFLFLISSATIFSLLEIQIEGNNGWAAKLPTWRFSTSNKFLSKIFPKNRPLTGYHLYLFTLVLLFIHSWIIFMPWNFNLEISTLIYYLSLIILEDFFWFLFNPSYGIKKFSSKYITWHSPWFLFMPLSYWLGIFALILLIIIK